MIALVLYMTASFAAESAFTSSLHGMHWGSCSVKELPILQAGFEHLATLNRSVLEEEIKGYVLKANIEKAVDSALASGGWVEGSSEKSGHEIVIVRPSVAERRNIALNQASRLRSMDVGVLARYMFPSSWHLVNSHQSVLGLTFPWSKVDGRLKLKMYGGGPGFSAGGYDCLREFRRLADASQQTKN